MKSISLAFTAFILLLATSCNNNKTTTDEVKAADTVATPEVPPPPPPAPPAPADVMLVWHKVGNFDKWLPSYEGHDSIRLANGLHNYVIGRDLSDPNLVLVALKMDDLDKAKSFSNSTTLQEAMKKSGVVGKPSVNLVDIQFLDTTTNNQTTRVMVTHKVKDYDAWKAAFDSHKQARMDAGLTDRAVGRGFDDKNTVTVVCAVSDVKKAKAFFSSKETKDKMASAGVEGAPTVHYYTVAKAW
ncbi:MAG TPA: hypothetical protein VK166_04220 [Chitinophagaceae bacterium]|nr:hypothetical protein [Chitinophagaceae bacterium]